MLLWSSSSPGSPEQSKLLLKAELVTGVNQWLVQNETGFHADNVDVSNEEVHLEPQIVELQNLEPQDEVNVDPHDRISNVNSNASNKSLGRKSNYSKSSRSSSALLQPEAEKAALLARAATLKKRMFWRNKQSNLSFRLN